jgi:hypothetical protein
VLLVRVLGDEDHEEGRHRLIIRCAKRYWKGSTHEQHHRVSDAGDAGVWDRDAVSNCGGSTLLPSPQSPEGQLVIDLGTTRSESRDLLTHPLGVSRRKPEHDVLGREKTTENVHRSLISRSERVNRVLEKAICDRSICDRVVGTQQVLRATVSSTLRT